MKDKIYKIVLVDDDPIAVELYKSILEEEPNCQVSAFNSGEELFSTPHFDADLYILDYNLGHLPTSKQMNGLDIVQKLQNNKPFIMISAQMDMEIALKIIKSGACDYIIKNETTLTNIQRSVRTVLRTIQINDDIVHLKRKNKLNLIRALVFTACLLALLYFLI